MERINIDLVINVLDGHNEWRRGDSDDYTPPLLLDSSFNSAFSYANEICLEDEEKEQVDIVKEYRNYVKGSISEIKNSPKEIGLAIDFLVKKLKELKLKQ
jgi:hypothetical protein